MDSPLRVLLVDDDPVVLEVTRAVLESMGHPTTTHDRGLGTSSVVAKVKPHIVLLDVELPGLDGDELVDLIHENQWKEDQPWPAVILHSGMEHDELQQLAQKSGARGALSKTHDIETFKMQFREIVESLS